MKLVILLVNCNFLLIFQLKIILFHLKIIISHWLRVSLSLIDFLLLSNIESARDHPLEAFNFVRILTWVWYWSIWSNTSTPVRQWFRIWQTWLSTGAHDSLKFFLDTFPIATVNLWNFWLLLLHKAEIFIGVFRSRNMPFLFHDLWHLFLKFSISVAAYILRWFSYLKLILGLVNLLILESTSQINWLLIDRC